METQNCNNNNDNNNNKGRGKGKNWRRRSKLFHMFAVLVVFCYLLETDFVINRFILVIKWIVYLQKFEALKVTIGIQF